MLDLNDLAFFVRAVDLGSFTRAAEDLGVSKSTLSQRIARLEDELGARLIERTSRRFAVTDLGRDLHRHASAMLIEAEAAESAVRGRLAEPRGVVRLTCPLGMTQQLAPLLARFFVRHPKVTVVQNATHRFVDLMAEGFDVGLRGHNAPLPDSELIRRRIAFTPWCLVAAPGYLASAAVPAHPSDLAQHQCLMVPTRMGEMVWPLRHPELGEHRLELDARLASDDLETLKQAALAGLGVAALPGYMCRDERASGALVHVLPGWTTGDAQLSLLFPPRRGRLPAVRVLIDVLLAELPPLLACDLPGTAPSSETDR